MRQLNTHDLITSLRLVKQMNIIDHVQELKEKARKIKQDADNKDAVEKAKEDIGIEMFNIIIEGIADERTEPYIYKFLSGPFECDPDTIRDMPLPELKEKFKELIKENSLADFFTTVSKLI